MTATALPKTLTLDYHQDPGHGWIAIPRTLARRILGPNFQRISPFSYQQSSTGLIFLEEDSDAYLLIQACRGQLIYLTFREVHTNSDSFIRRLPSFCPTTGVSALQWRLEREAYGLQNGHYAK